MLNMFDFLTIVLVRLTRGISGHLIERGRMYLQVEVSQEALLCFKQAQKLEIRAKVQNNMECNNNTARQRCFKPDFREHPDLLEGDDGLLSQTETASREQGHSLESS